MACLPQHLLKKQAQGRGQLKQSGKRTSSKQSVSSSDGKMCWRSLHRILFPLLKNSTTSSSASASSSPSHCFDFVKRTTEARLQGRKLDSLSLSLSPRYIMLTSTKALRPESGKNDLVQELKSYLKATTTKAAQLQKRKRVEETPAAAIWRENNRNPLLQDL